MEALRDFALLAYNYARVHRNQEPFMVTGYASLKLWSALNQDQEEVVNWYDSVPGCVVPAWQRAQHTVRVPGCTT